MDYNKDFHWWQLETHSHTKAWKKSLTAQDALTKWAKKESRVYYIYSTHFGLQVKILKKVGTTDIFWFLKMSQISGYLILQKECLNSKLTFWVMNFFIFSADMQKRYEMFALCIRVLAASTGFHRKFTIVFLSKHLFFIMGIYFTPLNEMGALYNRYVWCTYSTSTAV